MHPEPSHLPRTCGWLTVRPIVVKRRQCTVWVENDTQEDRSQRWRVTPGKSEAQSQGWWSKPAKGKTEG